jgi:hypothetical protein
LSKLLSHHFARYQRLRIQKKSQTYYFFLMDNGQVNMSLWPRFKMLFDLHLNSLRNANIKTLWEDDVHPHYVTRRLLRPKRVS